MKCTVQSCTWFGLKCSFPSIMLLCNFTGDGPKGRLSQAKCCVVWCHLPGVLSPEKITLQRLCRAGPRGRAREGATLGVHPLSWLLSNNRLEEVCGTLTKGTFSSRLLLSNQDKGCTPSGVLPLALPLGPALHNLLTVFLLCVVYGVFPFWVGFVCSQMKSLTSMSTELGDNYLCLGRLTYREYRCFRLKVF